MLHIHLLDNSLKTADVSLGQEVILLACEEILEEIFNATNVSLIGLHCHQNALTR